MEYKKLEIFIEKNQDLISKYLNKNIVSLDEMIYNVKKSKNKQKKLYEITKDISKIADYYDEKVKINLNRSIFTNECLDNLKTVFSENKLNDYKDVFKIIVSKDLEFDNDNWNLFYNTISDSVSDSQNESIDSNILYSLDFEDLTPKKLVEIYQRNLNDDLVEGGTFSFQSDTQEMMGIVNEFVLSQGKTDTLKYLTQGKNSDIKITELLKEVNAASLVEPFSFDRDRPTFKRAPTGQFDGFIMNKNVAKVILATKNENTNIENDSLFRHFITSLVIKTKMDNTPENSLSIRRKQKEWHDFFTSKENIKHQTEELLKLTRELKKEKEENLSLSDFYISPDFFLKLKQNHEAALTSGSNRVKVETKDKNGLKYLSYDVSNSLFGKNRVTSETGVIHLSEEEALEKINIIENAIVFQNELKSEIIAKASHKVLNEKFKAQVTLDAKKEDMVLNNEYLSIKSMISDYNQNTRNGLIELGVYDPSEEEEYNEEELKQYREELKEIDQILEFGYNELRTIQKIAEKAKVELVYFGAVSDKKSSLQNEYDKDYTENKYKNKEFRYGLNILAYANVLTASVKGGLKITPDASMEFVKNINLRAITKNKNGEFDIDLNKINNDNFINDIVYVTYKSMFENKTIKNDSINYLENFLNVSNVILTDVIEEAKIDEEEKLDNSIEETFNNSMRIYTEREEENFNLYKTAKSLKKTIMEHSKKISNVSLIDSVNQRLNAIISLSNDPAMQNLIKKYPIDQENKNKESRKARRKLR